jgi:hypothetical protein
LFGLERSVTKHFSFLRTTFSRAIIIVAVTSLAMLSSATADAASIGLRILTGKVESNGTGLKKYQVSLYAALIGNLGSGPSWQLLGKDASDGTGGFQILYRLPGTQPGQPQPLLFIEAVNGSAMLASAIGSAPLIPIVDVNERTTVATANAFAQFINGSMIQGNRVGMSNAISMAGNLANPANGNVGIVLSNVPNGSETSTTTLMTRSRLSRRVAH